MIYHYNAWCAIQAPCRITSCRKVYKDSSTPRVSPLQFLSIKPLAQSMLRASSWKNQTRTWNYAIIQQEIICTLIQHFTIASQKMTNANIDMLNYFKYEPQKTTGKLKRIWTAMIDRRTTDIFYGFVCEMRKTTENLKRIWTASDRSPNNRYILRFCMWNAENYWKTEKNMNCDWSIAKQQMYSTVLYMKCAENY